VWLDVAINGTLLGRIEVVLFAKRAPRTAENFRLLCTGELGSDAAGHRYHLKITDSGELRQGRYGSTPEYQALIDNERKRIVAAAVAR
ncbi:Peptidyl-prolyl cis-trans isomerase CYP18-4, partial [Tetrabaena socialis]